ncbi:hypothetical protein CcaverHIS002_0300870 [Cutaneotrichosporon cavernicola]|uniref:AB hydrolase-1 domain-containing protein n=1 Tax=Cutaneotrichosporon cavernicola TaxID=279322 RepID=A0AA48IAE2_9TREE|nr:uncharacterized protein CcaverHIS019_0300850 [Cutaneotrichosporon cavernicola]BEI82219.1 hypothetical protein CcaverHIS002_0300870 [Cutaneotrichosporon cavernicola]BEI90015.1 hypothetical protein CcaverHIS019_0300850 [Cutaneotrichosporon cavernicola]BEI97788.1 hypothetical protein CcaverHIS631_0300870 [Cutaneotrichosporon cavernicola]BEJ05566.1 hypothetical protein CcaverHIS641_0300880 [Cutaneotrichosporon cavernicola]
MFKLAVWARQIVRVVPRSPGVIARGAVDDVSAWVDKNVPSLKGTFTPSWWLPNGHLQTAYIVMGDFSKVDRVDYVRTMLRLPDGGTISLDITPPNHLELPADAPTLVVCHGLTGNANESYVRNVLNWAIKPQSEGGIGARGVVVNFRGCGGTPLTSPQLYSAAASLDLNSAAHYLRNAFPQSALHGIGFSLGASVLARYLGERGEESLLSSGTVIGCPWDVSALSHALEDGFFSSRLYSRALGANLIKLFFRHYERNPRMWEENERLKDCVPAMKNLRSMGNDVRLKMVDEVLVSNVGGPRPPWPFNSADDYYQYAGSHQLIHNIKVPTLGINAYDDPVVHGTALPITQVQDASHVYLAVTGGGGHLGWFDGPMKGPKSKGRWVVKPMGEFLTAAARDLPPRAPVAVAPGPGPEWATVTAKKEEMWMPPELEGWENEVVNGMKVDIPEPSSSSIGDSEGFVGGAPLTPALSAGVLSEDEEEAEMNFDISRSDTPVAHLHGAWQWVLAPPMICQTGAAPSRVGWKVLCRDEDTNKWSETAAPQLQGLAKLRRRAALALTLPIH